MSVTRPWSVLRYRPAPRLGRLGWRKVLLTCGAASTALYVGMDGLAALLYDGYSYTGQTISELSAIDAPTRPLWIPLAFVYGMLVLAFGFGIWASAGQKQALRIVAALVTGMGILSLAAWPFAPMHQREVLAAGGGTLSDTMHLVLASVNSLLFLLVIAFGATAQGKWFRLYSLVTIVAVLVFGGLTFMQSPGVSNDTPTPWIGVTERITVEGSMLWMAVLGFALWRRPGSAAN